MSEVRASVTFALPGGDLELPFFDVQGAHEGPLLTLISGVHGTEYTSIAAVREFAASLDPSTVHGRVVAVPIVNLPAFWARSPFVVPVDDKNLNRNFPGDPAGSYTEQLAHHITERFIKGSDYLIDLHAGDLPEALEPFAMYEESPVEAKAREMAMAYGVGHVVRQTAAVRTVAGSSAAVAADLRIPAIIAESGQNGLVDRPSVERHVAGLQNVARLLGVLPGEPTPVEPAREHEGWHWLRTPDAGWWQPAVPVGAFVEGGALLGTVTGVLGEPLQEIFAPEAGTLMFLTSSPAVQADGLLLGLAKG